MCGIAGFIALGDAKLESPRHALRVLGDLISHRGPDGHGDWISGDGRCGLVHVRLSIIDLSERASQPMRGHDGSVIAFNGEIYNFRDLRTKYQSYNYSTSSDTETILAAHAHNRRTFVEDLRGMFAFALWNPRRESLMLVRDRVGIKPLYYAEVDSILYFASEAKALLPFVPSIQTDPAALAEYLTFQYQLGHSSMFRGINQVPPGHILEVKKDQIQIRRYWDVSYEIDHSMSQQWAEERLTELLHDSIELHLTSDVEVGSYLSGGVDSSLIGICAHQQSGMPVKGFHGRFKEFDSYDESRYASDAADHMGNNLRIIDITATDFIDNIQSIIYHLDYPIAGPGSFPQFVVSRLASEHVKVVLGGQGGDEIFGGYARYLIAYLEQCLKAAIDGTYKNGNFVVTLESIIPNLGLLREYTPLLQDFWKSDLFGPIDRRFLRLIDRSTDMEGEVMWDSLDIGGVHDRFMELFNSGKNVGKEAYFDKMTHFEFKTLLPALLHVEDRMSMAHGLESRVPFLDHQLVEFMATVPADIKFSGGRMKHLLKDTFTSVLPKSILDRRDKMGFPVPLSEWYQNDLRDFVGDIFSSRKALDRDFMNARVARDSFVESGRFSRKTWALLSLELWHQEFHDKQNQFRGLLR